MSGNPDAASEGSVVDDKVVIHGRITFENSGEMRKTLASALRKKSATVSVDLSGVTYLDTSGWATLVEAVRIARKQGTRLELSGIRDQPRYIFEIMHLDRLFEVATPEANK
jgi:anti-sigma B factor antagonist